MGTRLESRGLLFLQFTPEDEKSVSLKRPSAFCCTHSVLSNTAGDVAAVIRLRAQGPNH